MWINFVRDLLCNVVRQPIYKKKKAKVLNKEGFGVEEVTEQPNGKKQQQESISILPNQISKQKDFEIEVGI